MSEAITLEGEMPALAGATAWLNSQPLAAGDLRGKIVLIDFCTYTCIYWIRTLPYVRAWAEKYRDRGVVVIGVHTPEYYSSTYQDMPLFFLAPYQPTGKIAIT